MRVFIAGASGVLGRDVIPLLRNQGHDVIALVRNQEAAALVRGFGAEPLMVDLLELDSFQQLVPKCDVVMHLATKIPLSPKGPADWQTNDLIRTKGTEHLLEVARKSHATYYVQQSIVFPYGDHGDQWITEEVPFSSSLAAQLYSAVEMEQKVRSQSEIPYVILRGGSFYGQGTGTPEQWIDRAKMGQLQVQGNGQHFVSLIHVLDMARAIVAAVNKQPFNRIYNVVDDEPVRQRELFEYISSEFGERGLKRDEQIVNPPSIRCSNQLIKQELGWAPQYPSYREALSS
ncbi:MAG: NAD-dependent epimerase/dehydratase family protein [Bacilli bacterium]|nr:NAD-dependent epimerase/dehydratase family protein [Bacilli bacterium]